MIVEIRSCITSLFSGQIRLCEQEDARYGDDFVYTIPWRFISQDTIEFTGVFRAQDKLPPSSWRVLMAECERLGAKYATFERKRPDGTFQRRTIRVHAITRSPVAATGAPGSVGGVVPVHVRFVRRLVSLVRLVRVPRRFRATDRANAAAVGRQPMSRHGVSDGE